jgi:hypothetical protein
MHKKISYILHRYHGFGESKRHFRPFSKNSPNVDFPVFVIVFGHSLRTYGNSFLKTGRGFFGNGPMHKNLSHIVHMYHGIRESKRYLRSFLPEIHQIKGEFYLSMFQFSFHLYFTWVSMRSRKPTKTWEDSFLQFYSNYQHDLLLH